MGGGILGYRQPHDVKNVENGVESSINSQKSILQGWGLFHGVKIPIFSVWAEVEAVNIVLLYKGSRC